MNESRKNNGNLTIKSDSLPLSVITTDVNLSRLPFFALSRKVPMNFKTELLLVETRDNKHLELLWKVTSNPEYGYPGSFAKKVHRAVEYLVTQKGFPVPEYLDFSLYDIAEILGLKRTSGSYSGKIYADIKNALFSITTTSIESKGVFCYLDNGKKRWVHDLFHIYERVVFAGESLPDGTIAENNRLYFGEWYIKALNSLYIKPLDFSYWKKRRSDIARRLYEYLSFISFATKCKEFSIGYHRLCEFLPIKTYNYFSDARRQMKAAHGELIQTGFLKEVAWRKSKTDSKKWIIVYYFGTRAKSELQRGFKDDTYRPVILAVDTAEIDEIELIELEYGSPERRTKSKKKQTKEEEVVSPMAQELINRGITKSVALDFAEYFPEEHIREKIDLHDINKATGMLTQNAAGWLREAITRDYKLSEEQKQKLSRLETVKAEEEVKDKLAEQAKEIQEQRLLEVLANFPSEEEWVEARVSEHIRVREDMRKFDPTRPSFTEEEIEQYRQHYQENFPQTDEERRKWLIINDNKYNLQNIILELSEQQEVKEEKKETSTSVP